MTFTPSFGPGSGSRTESRHPPRPGSMNRRRPRAAGPGRSGRRARRCRPAATAAGSGRPARRSASLRCWSTVDSDRTGTSNGRSQRSSSATRRRNGPDRTRLHVTIGRRPSTRTVAAGETISWPPARITASTETVMASGPHSIATPPLSRNSQERTGEHAAAIAATPAHPRLVRSGRPQPHDGDDVRAPSRAESGDRGDEVNADGVADQRVPATQRQRGERGPARSGRHDHRTSSGRFLALSALDGLAVGVTVDGGR